MKTPSLNDNGNFEVKIPSIRKKKKYPKYDFSDISRGSGKIEVLSDKFSSDTIIHFASSKKDAKKVHSVHAADLILDQERGLLIWNKNGAKRGFGKGGGVVARFKNIPELASSDFVFSPLINFTGSSAYSSEVFGGPVDVISSGVDQLTSGNYGY